MFTVTQKLLYRKFDSYEVPSIMFEGWPSGRSVMYKLHRLNWWALVTDRLEDFINVKWDKPSHRVWVTSIRKCDDSLLQLEQCTCVSVCVLCMCECLCALCAYARVSVFMCLCLCVCLQCMCVCVYMCASICAGREVCGANHLFKWSSSGETWGGEERSYIQHLCSVSCYKTFTVYQKLMYWPLINKQSKPSIIYRHFDILMSQYGQNEKWNKWMETIKKLINVSKKKKYKMFRISGVKHFNILQRKFH